MTQVDAQQAYADYIERFREAAGEVEFGAFVKFGGRLVRKLRADEFEPLYRDYCEVSRAYMAALERGDTINDMVVRALREKASELLLPPPL